MTDLDECFSDYCERKKKEEKSTGRKNIFTNFKKTMYHKAERNYTMRKVT